jgi:hypothetical protein
MVAQIMINEPVDRIKGIFGKRMVPGDFAEQLY